MADVEKMIFILNSFDNEVISFMVIGRMDGREKHMPFQVIVVLRTNTTVLLCSKGLLT